MQVLFCRQGQPAACIDARWSKDGRSVSHAGESHCVIFRNHLLRIDWRERHARTLARQRTVLAQPEQLNLVDQGRCIGLHLQHDITHIGGLELQ